MIKPLRFTTLAAILLAACSGAGYTTTPSSLETLLTTVSVVKAPVPASAAQKAPAPAGEQLFQQLHAQTEMTGQPNGHAYLDAKKFMFSSADNTGCGGGPGVTCLYSQVCAKGATGHGEDYKESGDANGDGLIDTQGMNAEHAWPQGFFNEAYPMKSDLHHIFPTFITPNNTRGSEPFSLVSRATYSTNSGSKMGAEGFEPANAVKGDIARAILYFVVRYYDKNIRDGVDYKNFWTLRVPMFLEWDRQDPPDAAERRRNDLIARFQGNRNPFVDDTALAGQIGLKVFQSH